MISRICMHEPVSSSETLLKETSGERESAFPLPSTTRPTSPQHVHRRRFVFYCARRKHGAIFKQQSNQTKPLKGIWEWESYQLSCFTLETGRRTRAFAAAPRRPKVSGWICSVCFSNARFVACLSMPPVSLGAMRKSQRQSVATSVRI